MEELLENQEGSLEDSSNELLIKSKKSLKLFFEESVKESVATW